MAIRSLASSIDRRSTAVVHGEDLAALAQNDAVLSVSADAIVHPNGLLGGLLGGVVKLVSTSWR